MKKFRLHSLSMIFVCLCLLAARTAQGNLVGLYTFEGNAQDVSGNGNHGAITGAVPFGAGFEGQAAQFPGTAGNFIDLPVNLTPATTPQTTFGAWVNAAAIAGAARHEIISTDNGGFDRALTIDSRDTGGGETGVARYAAFNGSAAVLPGSNASIADDWVFVAARYDQANSQTTLFVGNQKFVEPATMGASALITRIGAHPSNIEHFNGSIDNAFFFNESLSDAQIAAIAAGGAAAISSLAPADNSRLWSVDINGSGAPRLQTGVEALYGYGEVWNNFTVAHHAGTSVNPSLNLVNGEGQASPVTFSITGTVSGFNNAGPDAVRADYLFINAGGASANADWSLTGLDPDGTYELFAYGGDIANRDFNMLIDSDGDGSLLDEVAQNVGTNGFLFTDLVTDGTGRIIGRLANDGAEGNFAGFQLRRTDVEAIPEPASIALWLVLGVGLMCGAMRRAARSR